jgi:3-isopropylmalate dehydrogenase
MLLHWLGERRGKRRLAQAADLIERELDATIAQPQWRTADLGGPLGTKAFGERMAAVLAELPSR